MLYYHLVLSALLLGADLATARPTPAAPPPSPGQYPPSGSQPPQRPPPARQGTSYVPTAQQVQQGLGAAAWASGGTVPFVLGTGHTGPGLGMAGTSLVTGAASYGVGRYNRPPVSDIESQRGPQPPTAAYTGGPPSRANTVGSFGGPPQPPQQPSRANTVQYPPPQLPPAAHTYTQGSASSLGPQQHSDWAAGSTPSVQGGPPQGWSSHSSLQPPPVAYHQPSPQAASSSAVQGVQGVQGVRQRPGAQSSTSVNSAGSGSSSGVSSGVAGYRTPEGKGSASSLGHQSGGSGGR